MRLNIELLRDLNWSEANDITHMTDGNMSGFKATFKGDIVYLYQIVSSDPYQSEFRTAYFLKIKKTSGEITLNNGEFKGLRGLWERVSADCIENKCIETHLKCNGMLQPYLIEG